MTKLLLPPYHYETRQPKVPFRARVAARHVDRSGSRIVAFEVRKNRTGSRCWLYATDEAKDGSWWRASDTLASSSSAKCERWRAAVQSGNVAVGKDGDKFGLLPLLPMLLTGMKAQEMVAAGKKIGSKLKSRRRK